MKVSTGSHLLSLSWAVGLFITLFQRLTGEHSHGSHTGTECQVNASVINYIN